MSLSFQNKIVFPAPETSYTTQSAFGQVVYIPRNIMSNCEKSLSDKQKYTGPNSKKLGKPKHLNRGANARNQNEEMMKDKEKPETEVTDADLINPYLVKSQENLDKVKEINDQKETIQEPKFKNEEEDDIDFLSAEIEAQKQTLGTSKNEEENEESKQDNSTDDETVRQSEELTENVVEKVAEEDTPNLIGQKLNQESAVVGNKVSARRETEKSEKQEEGESDQIQDEQEKTSSRNSSNNMDAPKLLQEKGQKENEEENKSSGAATQAKSIKKPEDPKESDEFLEYIPCLFLPCEEGGNKVVIYFHGNAEDIGLAFDLMYMFGAEMQMHVLAVEYPGYGLYKTSKPDEQKMKEDADSVYDYLTQVVGVKESDVILFGRSMGSGPTSYLASRKEAHSLLLMSPYMSIKDAARSLFGWASFLSVIVYERFRNIDLIAKARCPCFFLHGQKDTLIPHSHSIELNRVCPRESYLHLPPEMDHNEFQLIEDLVAPFRQFITQLEAPQKRKPHKVITVIDVVQNNDNQEEVKEEVKQINKEEEEQENNPVQAEATQGQGLQGDQGFTIITADDAVEDQTNKAQDGDQSDEEETKTKTQEEDAPAQDTDTNIASDLSDRAIGKTKQGNVRYPSDPFKYKYMINRHEKLDIHCNLFDSSFVEYFLDDGVGNFDILFDQRLYEPPRITVDLEKSLAEEAEVKAKAQAQNK